MKDIKQLFFTYRNGIVAETLRRAGDPHKMIFGLQIPQISEIAKRLIEAGDSASVNSMGKELWAGKSSREARLLACYLINPADFSFEEAMEMARSVISREEADILCFRLLKKLPFTTQLLTELTGKEFPPGSLPRYCGEALKRNIGEQ